MNEKTAPFPDTERRASHRHRVLKGALVLFGNFSGAYDCLVRNVTEEGAKLGFDPTVAIPAEFELLIPGEAKIAPAELIWREKGEMGVRFTGPWRHHNRRG